MSQDFMAADDYAVIYTGALQAGLSQDEVVEKLAQLFKQREDKLAAVLKRSKVVLKRGLSKEHAERYAKAFVQAGMQVIIRSASERKKAKEAGDKNLEDTSETPAASSADTILFSEGLPTKPMARAPEQPSKTKRSDKSEPKSKSKSKPDLDPQVLIGLIKGKLKPVRITSGYRRGLLAVAATMVLLPALYVAMTAGVGYFIYWWAGAGWEIADVLGLYVQVLLYGLPLLIAIVLFFFMLKPLVAGESQRETALIVTPVEQPLLFAFVNALCDRVGAPRPKRVQLDCAVNASASFTGGFGGLLSRRLTLTLGTPLIAGMNTRELAGVLAHEFGHFSQGAGMTASHLIRTVIFWFYRAGYNRDAWDEKLEHYANNCGDGWISLGLMMAQGCIWLVRQLLVMLLLLGELVSRFMMRHMEFDADTYEAQIAGSNQFRRTSVRMRLLSAAYQSVCEDLGALWEDRKLVDDLPSAVADRAVAMEKEFNQHVDAMLAEEQSSYFDTHPADIERIQKAEALKAPPMFRLELPASVLIKDFEELAKQSTRRFYVAELRISPSEQGLVDRASMQATADEARARDEALEEYARDLFMPERFLEPQSIKPHLDLDDQARKEKLEKCVTNLRAGLPDITAVVDLVRRLDAELKEAHVQSTVKESGVNTREIMTIQGELNAALKKLKAFEDILVERLAIGLAGWVKKLDEGDDELKLFNKLTHAQLGLMRQQKTIDDLHVSTLKLYRTLKLMEITYNPADGSTGVPESILNDRIKDVEAKSDQLADALEDIEYPFDRAGGSTDLFTHVRDGLPTFDSDEPGSIIHYFMELSDAIARLHVRIMSALCHRARDIETGLGVAPIRIKLKPTDASADQ